MDVADVAKQMLDAARQSAGSTWGQIQHDFVADLGRVLRNGAEIEARMASRELSEIEGKDLLEDQSRILFVLSQEGEEDAEILAQNAINAAIDVLWMAVRTAARL
jgi:hypothetical protein